MRVFECIKGKRTEDATNEGAEFIQGNLYYLFVNGLGEYYEAIRPLEDEADVSWLHEHFKELSKDEIAAHHYEGLIRHNIYKKNDGRYKILSDMTKEEFIQHYPLSCLPFVSRKRFWMSCHEVGIVEHYWIEEDNYSEFEMKLRDVLERLPSKDREEYQTASVEDVKKLFQAYNK